jgi:hypothetical protein
MHPNKFIHKLGDNLFILLIKDKINLSGNISDKIGRCCHFSLKVAGVHGFPMRKYKIGRAKNGDESRNKDEQTKPQ